MTEERIRIFAVDVRSLPDIPDPQLSELFPEWRAEGIRRYRMKADRIRSAWSELLLRAVLEELCGIPRTEWRILRRKDGKPYVSGMTAAGGSSGNLYLHEDSTGGDADRKNPEISLSHSGCWAAASVGPVPHGIDVEVPRNPEMIPGIAKRWFLPAEAEALERVTEKERTELFFRFWTVKESFLKMTGTGLREGPQAADALQLLSGSGTAAFSTAAFSTAAFSTAAFSTAAFSTVLPDGAVLSCCGPDRALPEAPEIFSADRLRSLYGL